jgi:hypothetical protein
VSTAEVSSEQNDKIIRDGELERMGYEEEMSYFIILCQKQYQNHEISQSL